MYFFYYESNCKFKSIVANSFARMVGLRSGSAMTLVPNFNLVVLEAMNDIATTVSKVKTGDAIRSVNQIESIFRYSIRSA